MVDSIVFPRTSKRLIPITVIQAMAPCKESNPGCWKENTIDKGENECIQLTILMMNGLSCF